MTIDCSKCPERGCCCGIVIMPTDLINKHKSKFQTTPIQTEVSGDFSAIITEDSFCIFLNRETRTCSIYEDRPLICKQYGTGTNEDLLCPYFKPNGHQWSEAAAKRIRRRLNHLLKEVFKHEDLHIKQSQTNPESDNLSDKA